MTEEDHPQMGWSGGESHDRPRGLLDGRPRGEPATAYGEDLTAVATLAGVALGTVKRARYAYLKSRNRRFDGYNTHVSRSIPIPSSWTR
jgi:hypothetical protein